MNWDDNNKACVSIWVYLTSTNQIRPKRKFPDSAGLTMKGLRFWNDLSPEATRGYAQGWAEWYVSYITTKDGAKFETGFNWAKTVAAMLAVMTDGTKTLADLAGVVNDAIWFHKEVKP